MAEENSPFDELEVDELPPGHEDGDDRVNDPPAIIDDESGDDDG